MRWTDVRPADAVDLDLSERLDIEAPLNENGERCPWPWEPQQLGGLPIGQYRCPYCYAMVVAGMPHIDYRTESGRPWLDEVTVMQLEADPDYDPRHERFHPDTP